VLGQDGQSEDGRSLDFFLGEDARSLRSEEF
jgi:hypothetical protein